MRSVATRAVGALVLVTLAVVLTGATALAGGSGGGLSKYDRDLLRQARDNGEQTVTLIVAAKLGATKTAVKEIEALGATAAKRDDQLGYVRAVVPTDKVEAVAALGSIEAVDLNEIIPLDPPRPEGFQAATPQPAPGPTTPRDNPYMPVGEIGAAAFTATNPTWDGRGVTVGIVDTGIDLDHPSLQTTTTGEAKIVDWVTGTDPVSDNDPTWVNMQGQVSGASFAYQGATYTAPAAGSYRIGLFNERDPRLGGEIGRDVNRDGNPAGSSGTFAVLWDTSSNKVYVDANQNKSFADEPAMTDYKVNRDVSYFGTDNPATAIVERMPFVVQTDGKAKFVNIGIVSGAHGSHVAGIVGANQMFGGAMSGAAPGAKFVSLRACLFVAGCTAVALTEGMIYVAKQSNVDVINMSIGGLPALNDGNNARARLYDRLIEQSNVQMFISAGNSGPGVNTIGDPSVAPLVMSVGAYLSQASMRSNYGADTPFLDNLNYFTSRGPAENGAFKPQIIAPGSAVSTTPLWQPGGPVPGTYALPPGFAMFNGTSMAAPQATGGAALLLSAAKQAGAQKQPDQLRQAINSSARYIDPTRFQAFDQGNGLMNVPAAWNLLKQNIKTVKISSSVDVNTLLSGFLATPGFGPGIYDREGVTAGSPYTRTYTFTRTSGGGGTITYNLSWVGNDGTFSTASSIALPLNKPVTLDVLVTPSYGSHSAVLNLDDPSTTGIDYQTMNTVLVPYEFNAGNGYSQTVSGTIGRAQQQHFFFRIPAGTPAFKVDMTGGGTAAGTGQIRFLRWHPWGLGIESNAVSNCYNPPTPGSCSTGSPTSRTVSNPQAGVWEVSVDTRRTSDADFTAFTLTGTILGATVAPNPDTIASATIGVPVSRSYTLTNLFGAFTGRASGTALGSARLQTPTIANLEVQEYLVDVTAGSTSLRATIGSPSDPAADLDLFVYNCTSGTCVLAGQNADGDSEESVTIASPAAGSWKVVVDGFAVPAGTTTYKYVDVFANPAFGSVSVTDANALRPSGSSWTVPGSVTANAAPASGRVLLGNVQVRTDTSVLVGSGDVIVESVTP